MIWTPSALSRLERAIDEGTRVQIRRRGGDIVLIPVEIRQVYGGEILVGRHLGTGDRVQVPMDDVEAFTVIG
ncbi:MAG TPA: hypothetical protein VF665_07185 [Longimicrobium sp.]|uniref:hypothetical protein n=1 Tax=Longimicrobium sp. TaxID=2029185 RepID=UPI002ED84EEC